MDRRRSLSPTPKDSGSNRYQLYHKKTAIYRGWTGTTVTPNVEHLGHYSVVSYTGDYRHKMPEPAMVQKMVPPSKDANREALIRELQQAILKRGMMIKAHDD